MQQTASFINTERFRKQWPWNIERTILRATSFVQAVCVIATRQRKRYATDLSTNSYEEVFHHILLLRMPGNVYIQENLYRIKVRVWEIKQLQVTVQSSKKVRSETFSRWMTLILFRPVEDRIWLWIFSHLTDNSPTWGQARYNLNVFLHKNLELIPRMLSIKWTFC